jgi:S-formylglutathione hydrolase FrmB
VGISRRNLVIGSSVLGAVAGVGAWGLLADARLVPGRSVMDDAFGRCDIDATQPKTEPGVVVKASFFSAHRSRAVGYLLGYPPGAAGGAKLPVCLVLHGSGTDYRDPFDGIGYHRFLAAAVAAGVPPFVLASVDGGETFWHPRANGDNPMAMMLEDFPVVLRQHGLPVDRFAVLGYSMGGFGALVAASTAPKRFVAAVASAPALWRSYDDARSVNDKAFDSAEDWRTWGDLRTRTGALKGLAVRIDCGESDSFAPALSALREQLPDPGVVHLAKGCHDAAFWESVAPEQLKLIGTALTPPKAP